MRKCVFRSGHDGAEQVLNLACASDNEVVTGAYYEDGRAVDFAKTYDRQRISFLFDAVNKRIGSDL